MRQTMKVAAVLSAASLALAACGSDTSTDGTATDDAAAKTSDVKVGLAYDVGGRGDQSFNDSAAKGLDKAKDEFGLETKEAAATAGENEAAQKERLQQLVDAGYTHIIAVGFAYAKSVGQVAKENPDVNFAIIDDASEDSAGDNVAQLTFAEEQGSFLVGAAAALKTKTDNIGFVGGVNVPLIHKFEAGFEAGAKAVNKDIKIQSKYLTEPPDFSGFADPAKGKTAAEGMLDKGADVIYHAAGGSGGGVFTAVAANKAMAIGVDSDQALTAEEGVRDVIITSMVKRLDTVVYDYLKASVEGEAPAGPQVFDLKSEGVAYATTGDKVADIADKLDAYKQQIIDGEITVPSE
ncbi:BMP family lipoprotein [Janibacter sp. G1551]|uniref:BMP family lipoprotein n=1 Tax=Janibacter sp. G1551 TaxID=3420440 RepID=UPI003D081AB5